MSNLKPVLIGAGPASLAAAYALDKQQIPTVLLEQEKQLQN